MMQSKGRISEKGYRRIYVFDPKKGRKRLRMEHNLVWEQHHGEIPEGYDVHHINENKLDNRIENLELIPHGEHKRRRAGQWNENGVWVRKCTGCGTVIEASSNPSGRCLSCKNEAHRQYMFRTGRIAKLSTKRGRYKRSAA